MNRDRSIDALKSERFDVLVIGGGITGAGVALDAASRGLRVALVEKSDFAHGTSSRSSKQIHGGLRYLGQFQFGVTRDSASERELLMRLAPHLIRPVRYLLPLRRSLIARPVLAGMLSLYDSMSSVPPSRRHAHIGRDEVRRVLPLIRDDVTGAFEYSDAIADDCRLVMHVLKKAASLGATIANYVEVREFRKAANGDVAGVEAFDVIGGDRLAIQCRIAVNATGVWCDDIRGRLDPGAAPLLRVSKGTHLVLDPARLRVSDAVAIPRTRQGHHIFLSPWEGRTLVGTTDTPYGGDTDRPLSTGADVDSLLAALDEWFPHAHVTRADVLSVFSGLRPLIGAAATMKTSKIARDARVECRSGLITVTGGKLTTFRRMAKDVVDLIATAPCRTDRLPLLEPAAMPEALPPDIGEHLYRAFGEEAAAIASREGADARLIPLAPVSVAEVDHVIETEMAMSVGDVLLRRTRIGLTADDHGASAAPLVASRLAERHGWRGERRKAALHDFAKDAAEFVPPGR